MRLTNIFAVIDFNSQVSCGHSDREGMAHERRQTRLLASIRISSPPRVPQHSPIGLRLSDNGQWGLTGGLTQHADMQNICGPVTGYLLNGG